MSPWLFNIYMDEVKEGGSELPGGWERMEIPWPLVRVMVGWFAGV